MADLKVETRVNECYFGLVGILTENDPSDCVWRSYEPELPIYKIQLESIADIDGTYVPYQCQNWYSATWENWPIPEDLIET